MNNKLMYKILGYGYFAALLCFVVIHGVTYDVKEMPADMLKVDGVIIPDSPIEKAKTKTETLNDIALDKKKKESGTEEEYVQPVDLHKFQHEVNAGVQEVAKGTNAPVAPPVVKTAPVVGNNNAGGYQRPTLSSGGTAYVTPDNNKVAENKVAPMQAPAMAAPRKNPFGTIKSENNGGNTGKPEEVNMDVYYEARVYGDQTIQTNTELLLRNKTEFTCSGVKIPPNSVLHGVATFAGNRVQVVVSRVNSALGEFPIRLVVLDNDRILGIYDKAPIDEVVNSTADNANINQNVSNNQIYGTALNNTTRGAVNGVKQLIQKSRSLTLPNDYVVYLTYDKKK